MPPKFEVPERCLLEQVAHWFINGVMPVPDEIYKCARLDQDYDSAMLRELFLCLLQYDCEPQANLVLAIRHDSNGVEIRMPRTISRNREVNLKKYNLDEIDFQESKIIRDAIFFDYTEQEKSNIRSIESTILLERFTVIAFFADLTIDFEKLSRSLVQGLDSEPAHKISIRGERDCEEWLTGLMKRGKPEFNKGEYLKQALVEFPVSQRGFNSAWRNAVRESANSDWAKPGRKS